MKTAIYILVLFYLLPAGAATLSQGFECLQAIHNGRNLGTVDTKIHIVERDPGYDPARYFNNPFRPFVLIDFEEGTNFGYYILDENGKTSKVYRPDVETSAGFAVFNTSIVNPVKRSKYKTAAANIAQEDILMLQGKKEGAETTFRFFTLPAMAPDPLLAVRKNVLTPKEVKETPGPTSSASETNIPTPTTTTTPDNVLRAAADRPADGVRAIELFDEKLLALINSVTPENGKEFALQQALVKCREYRPVAGAANRALGNLKASISESKGSDQPPRELLMIDVTSDPEIPATPAR